MTTRTSVPETAVAAQHAAGNDTPTDWLASLWQPAFPSPQLVDQAAALFPHLPPEVQARRDEGPRPYIRIGPGVVEVRSRDHARADRTAERELRRREIEVEMMAAYLEEYGQLPDDPEPTRCITEWSRKSRANMVRTLGLIDFTPMYSDPTRMPAMVTFTYPGDWLTVVPSGRVLKRHMKAFRKRYERAWGEPLRNVWKLEFQARGAPHVHMLMSPPHGHSSGGQAFREWLSSAWAAVVAHPDPDEYARHLAAGTGIDYAEGLRATDPKRVAVYFTKHSQFRDKEYQHRVPAEWCEAGRTPGRFWGYWGLERHSAVVELDQADATTAGRTLRRWAAAQNVTREVRRPRVKGGRAISAYPDVIGLAGAQLLAARTEKTRKVRTRARRMRANRGFVMVNDGAAMASQLARSLYQQSQ